MDRILALYDTDVLYATKFMEYYNKRNDTDFKVSVFTRIESLVDFLRQNHVEILLYGTELDLEEQFQKNVRFCYQLSDTPPSKVGQSVLQLSKYQSVNTLVNRITVDYQQKTNIVRENDSNSKMNILSIFTPVQGLEKKSFAWSLCLQLSERENVLLIQLDLLPVSILTQTQDSRQSLSEFIYYLKGNANISKMNTLLSRYDRLSYLSGIFHGSDILSISREDMQKWVEELRLASEFNTVVFYAPCNTEAITELMKLSDMVLVPMNDNAYESATLKEWDRQISQSDMEMDTNKFRVVYINDKLATGQIPISIQELMDSEAWYAATHFISTLENQCGLGHNNQLCYL